MPRALGVLALALVIRTSLAALDQDHPPGPEQPQPPPVPPTPETTGWTHEVRPGAFVTAIYTSPDSNEAPDPAIRGTTGTLTYRLVLDAGLAWRSDSSAVDQTLHAVYGETRVRGAEWAEGDDDLRYDGVYRHDLTKPTFAYRGWGAETSFTAPGDREDLLDPIRVYGSWGIGQLYRNLFPKTDSLEVRVGVRIQKSWGPYISAHQNDLLVGPELIGRYERVIDENRRFFIAYEGWGDFGDLGHYAHLITAGASMHFTTHIAVDLALRAYYESRPRDVETTVAGYNRMFIRQDCVLGVTTKF